jgi:hypothetical protein
MPLVQDGMCARNSSAARVSGLLRHHRLARRIHEGLPPKLKTSVEMISMSQGVAPPGAWPRG